MDKSAPRFATYLGVGLTSMAALANEIILTRVFSVTLFYHFAFSVISIALLGSGAAGIWLHLSAKRLERSGDSRRLLVWLAVGFAVALVAAFRLYGLIPLTVGQLGVGLSLTLQQAGYLTLVYLILAVPYLFAGGTLALALYSYQSFAGRVYFADLVGAGLGCLLSVAALQALGGNGAVLIVSLVAALSALAFGLDAARTARAPLAGAAGVTALLVAAVALQAVRPWFSLPLRQTYKDQTPVFEAWNAFSRITVYEDTSDRPFGWGISREYLDSERNLGDPGHYLILTDEKTGTPIMQYSGVTGEPWYAYLRWDLTAMPYYLHDGADVFVIGPGGGRDVVTAYEFGARRVVGVELNPITVGIVKDDFGDYAGNIYNLPNVDIFVDDARTYLAGSDEQFDIIQASLVDTLAASSAGAFALSENGIYTQEAFEGYYDHLTDGGIVNFSRWYFPGGPAESLRLVALGMAAWEASGVADPGQHIIVVANLEPDIVLDQGLAGMLLKKTAFTEGEIDEIVAIADQMGFAVLYAPGHAADNPVSDLITSPDREAFIRDYPLDISPPTDDRPFFFNVVRISDLGQRQFFDSGGVYSLGAQATMLLVVTLIVGTLLAGVMIVLPLLLKERAALKSAGTQAPVYIAYFAALGLAFILIEIPMVQRLNIYLGSPTYALVVVLFSILLFSGIGSYTTQRVAPAKIQRAIVTTLVAAIGLLVIYTLGLSALLRATQRWDLPLRIALAVTVLVPVGLLMGRPFPLALRYVGASGHAEMVPWLWATNSALSVVASALSVILATRYGFSFVFWVGIASYVLALSTASRFEEAEDSIAARAARKLAEV